MCMPGQHHARRQYNYRYWCKNTPSPCSAGTHFGLRELTLTLEILRHLSGFNFHQILFTLSARQKRVGCESVGQARDKEPKRKQKGVGFIYFTSLFLPLRTFFMFERPRGPSRCITMSRGPRPFGRVWDHTDQT